MAAAPVIQVDKKKLAKPPLQLHYLGDRILRKPAKRIAKVDAEARELAKTMLQTMYSENGIGLAAPQVAIAKQMIVIDIEPDNAATPALVLINPQVTAVKDTKLTVAEEGCLSIPGVYLDVVRPEVVTVKFRDESGRPQTLTAGGLLARAIQHEMDHLNGVLFVDRVENDLALTDSLKKQGFSRQAVKPIR